MEPTCYQIELPHGGHLRIEPVAARSFRMRLRSTGAFREPVLNRYGILRNRSGFIDFRIDRSDTLHVINTGEATMLVDPLSGRITLYHRSGGKLLESDSPPRSAPAGGFSASFALDGDEHLYGLGDQTRQKIGKREHLAEMWVTNQTSYAPIPFVMSTRGWGLTVNTTWRHTIDCGSADGRTFTISGNNGDFDLYLFAGDGLADILNLFTDIAGKPALLPQRAYGLTYICHELSDAKEMIDEALKFRKEDIPCDTIGLDRGWTETPSDYSTLKKWHPSRFYIPSSLPKGPHTFIGTLHRHGFHLNLLLLCDYDLSLYEEWLAAGHGEESIDADERPEAWYDHLRPFVDSGVGGFKLSGSDQALVHPQRVWGNGMSDEQMHNLYPVLLGKQMYEGFRRQTGFRPMIYSVAGYTGFQQYVASWAGTSPSGPETLVSMLNHGLSGHSNTSCDMDIFTPEGIHFGFLQSWSQINSWAYFRHPSLLEDPLHMLFIRYVKLRYRLLPYLYSMAHVAARTGLPIMRAMPLAFPGDPLAGKADNQYMLGDSLLVAAFTRRVYLPEGLWIDYWTGTAYHGPKVVDYDVPNNAGGPLFIRGGAIIPEWPDMEYVGQSSVERLTVRIYPYRSGEFVLIEDDGISFEYENGAAAETRFACESDDVQISIQVFPRQGRYTGIPESRSYELFVRTAGKPIHVAINGETCAELPKKRSGPSSLIDKGWRYDRMEGTVSLCLTDPGESGAPIQIKIASGKLIDKSAANRNLSAERVSRGDSLASVWHSTETGLKIALETRETEKAVALFHTLWSERLGVSPTTDEVREFALSLGGMLAQMIERMGLSVKETLRADYDRLINLQALDTVQSVRELLHGMMDRITEQMILERQTGLHPLVRQTFDLIERELDGPINLHDIAERLHVSPSHLSRLIRKETGKTFSDHVMMRRMEHAKNMLQQGFKVNDVAKALGFEDSSYLAKVFRKYWGVSPSVYKV